MSTNEIYRAPIGTKDIFGEESRTWVEIIKQFALRANADNYDLAITPTFENFEVFSRVGQDTDIVTKEMYDFEDKGGRRIALKPEGTAGLVRAIAQHNPIMPIKSWYFTSVFRYERPQKGRLREHHQLGIEAFGIDNPEIDVEVILFAYEFLQGLGLNNFSLSINSLGDIDSRAKHLEALNIYFQQFEAELGETFSERVKRNPFRVLDTKVPQWLEVVKNAPSILDFISDASRNDFEYVKNRLDECEIKYNITPQLVRGLDYYTNTTFEFISQSLDAAQSTICGGGRYNKLVSDMGGKEIPGIGFGLGIERLILALEAEAVALTVRSLDIMIIDLVRNNESISIAHRIKSQARGNGYSVDCVYEPRSFKSSLKQADRLKSKFAIIIGEDEITRGVVLLRDMNSGEQSECNENGLIAKLSKAKM